MKNQIYQQHNIIEEKTYPRELTGGKGFYLKELVKKGYTTAPTYILSTRAYQEFVKSNRLETIIHNELGRKPIETMRWEEVWDSALRIRAEFIKAEIPKNIKETLLALYKLFRDDPLIVRSSSTCEDSMHHSFAGIHDSIAEIESFDRFILAIKKVWASLWSDAAIIYKKELKLEVVSLKRRRRWTPPE